MKRYIIFGLAAPVVLWAGIVIIGRKRADTAGLMLVKPGNPPLPSGLAVAAVGAGLLAAYLSK